MDFALDFGQLVKYLKRENIFNQQVHTSNVQWRNDNLWYNKILLHVWCLFLQYSTEWTLWGWHFSFVLVWWIWTWNCTRKVRWEKNSWSCTPQMQHTSTRAVVIFWTTWGLFRVELHWVKIMLRWCTFQGGALIVYENLRFSNF